MIDLWSNPYLLMEGGTASSERVSGAFLNKEDI